MSAENVIQSTLTIQHLKYRSQTSMLKGYSLIFLIKFNFNLSYLKNRETENYGLDLFPGTVCLYQFIFLTRCMIYIPLVWVTPSCTFIW